MAHLKISDIDQNAMKGNLCCINQACDFFLTEYPGQVRNLLRIRRFGNTPASLQHLHTEETQGCQPLRHGVRGQFPSREQRGLVLTNLLRTFATSGLGSLESAVLLEDIGVGNCSGEGLAQFLGSEILNPYPNALISVGNHDGTLVLTFRCDPTCEFSEINFRGLL